MTAGNTRKSFHASPYWLVCPICGPEEPNPDCRFCLGRGKVDIWRYEDILKDDGMREEWKASLDKFGGHNRNVPNPQASMNWR